MFAHIMHNLWNLIIYMNAYMMTYMSTFAIYSFQFFFNLHLIHFNTVVRKLKKKYKVYGEQIDLK